MNPCEKECYWIHEGKENNCWYEHEPSDNCGDYEPLNDEEFLENFETVKEAIILEGQ